MTLTVAQLIRKLKTLDPKARVVFCDHDQNPEQGEIGSPVGEAFEAPAALKERGYGVVLTH